MDPRELLEVGVVLLMGWILETEMRSPNRAFDNGLGSGDCNINEKNKSVKFGGFSCLPLNVEEFEGESPGKPCSGPFGWEFEPF